MCKNTLHKRKTLVITISGANVQAVRKFTFKSIHDAIEKSICGTFFLQREDTADHRRTLFIDPTVSNLYFSRHLFGTAIHYKLQTCRRRGTNTRVGKQHVNNGNRLRSRS